MSVSPETEMAPDEPVAAEEVYGVEPHLTMADGFRFGCGLILSFVAFSFVLVILVAAGVLLGMLLGMPLPFGLP